LPARSRRQVVERLNPVISRTALKRRYLSCIAITKKS
jgi:hypothetical protein